MLFIVYINLLRIDKQRSLDKQQLVQLSNDVFEQCSLRKFHMPAKKCVQDKQTSIKQDNKGEIHDFSVPKTHGN